MTKISNKLNHVARQAALNADIIKAALVCFLKKNDIKGKAVVGEGAYGIEETDSMNVLKLCNALKDAGIINKIPYLEDNGTRDHIRFFVEDQDQLIRSLYGETSQGPVKATKHNMK